MRNPKKHFIIKKVPLQGFLKLLNDLYIDGADFVDLHGEVDETGRKDNITVSVPLDYMSEEFRNSPGPPPPAPIDDEEEAQKQFPATWLTEEEVLNLLKNV